MMTAGQVDAWISALMAEALRARPEDGVAEWASKACFIPPEVSPDAPGWFSLDYAPLQDIVFYAYDSPDWEEFIGVKSSQYGLSFAAHICALFDAVWKNRNVLLSLDSESEAKRVSMTRLQPLIRECVDLAAKVIEGPAKGGDLTLLLKGLTFFLTGSFSPTALANKTIGLGICDECDNYPASPKGESNAIDLVRDRLKRPIDSMLIAFSKPKDKNTLIWPEFLSGSRHKCFLPCPACGLHQELVREQLVYEHCKTMFGGWDLDRIENETFYRCIDPKCGAELFEEHKPEMIANRVWKATHGSTVDFKSDERRFHVELVDDGIPAKPRKLSAHISDLYQLGEKDSWGKIMAEWIDAEGNSSKRKRVQRGRFALPWTEEEVRVSASDLDLLVRGYRRGQCPVRPDIVLMGVDVQKDVKKWVKVAFLAETGECWVIDWGECLTFEQLVVECDKPVEVLKWDDDVPEEERVDPVVYKALIDEGGGDGSANDNQGPVRDFVITTFLGQIQKEDGRVLNDFRFYSCYGRGGLSVKNWKDSYDPKAITHNGFETVVYRFNDSLYKKLLYEDRIRARRLYQEAKKKGDEKVEEPIGLYMPICPPGRDSEEGIISWEQFKKELSQEARVWDPKKQALVWQDPPEENDLGDALKYCFGEFDILRPALLRMKEAA